MTLYPINIDEHDDGYSDVDGDGDGEDGDSECEQAMIMQDSQE